MKKNKIIAFCTVLIAVMLLSFSTVFASEASSEDATADTSYSKIIYYEDVTAYRGTPETIDGYVFAGWFSDKSCGLETALSSNDKSGPAYAKYVPEEILGVKVQTTSKLWNSDTTDDETGALRFVTSVDSLNYRQVGFIINIGGNNNYKASKYVYKQLYAEVGEGNSTKIDTYVPSELFHESSEYFKTWTVTNIAELKYLLEFDVTPYWVTLDGTTVKGDVKTVTVNQVRSWDYVFVDDSGEADTDHPAIGTRDYPYQSLEAALDEMDTILTEQIAVGMEGVDRSSSVYVLKTLTEESREWEEHDLDLVVTTDPEASETATLDFSAIQRVHVRDSATFDKLNLSLYTAGNGTLYAFGNRMEVTANCNVEDGSHIAVYGGGYNADVDSTDLSLYTGTWRSIYGGSWESNVLGDTHVYIAGDVNSDITYTDDSGSNNIYGGCNCDNAGTTDAPYDGTVYGDTHVTITGNAKLHYVRGSGYKTNVEGTCYVNIEGSASIYGVNGAGAFGATNNSYVVVKGGTIYQVFGGNTSNGGTVNNTNVQILGGTIKRRIYGGSYNDTSGFGWADTNYHVDGYSSVTIGNGATISLNEDMDTSLCAVSRNGSNIDPEIGVLILNSEKTETSKGFNNLSIYSGADLYAHFLVNVGTGGTVTSEKDILRITPDSSSGYATVKDASDNVLFQCQGEGTYSLSGLTASSSMQTITVTFSDSATLSGNYVLSYGDNSYSYFDSLSAAMAAVSTPSTTTDGESTQKTATITICAEDTTVDSTLALTDKDNVVIQNADGVNATITRGTGLTEANMFDVAEGCSLTIDGTVVVDGNGTNVQGPSMIKNAGTFTLAEGATLQNAYTACIENADAYNGAALYNMGVATINGTISGNKAYNGAIYIATDGVVNLTETAIVSGNTASNGGAIFINRGTLNATGTTFQKNYSSNNGGVVYVNGYYSSSMILGIANFDSCIFTENESTGASGGVAYVKGSLKADNCTFENSKASTSGGAICIYDGKTIADKQYIPEVTVTNSTFNSNIAGTRGGAIDVNGGDYDSIVISGCTFTGNDGNGSTIRMHTYGYRVNLSDSTFNGDVDGNADVIYLNNAVNTLGISGKITGAVVKLNNATAQIVVNGMLEDDSDITITPKSYEEGLQVVSKSNETMSDATLAYVAEILDVTQVSGNYWFINSTGYLSQVVAKINGTEGSYADVLTAIADTSSAVEIQFLRDVEIFETIEIPTGANVSITNATGANVTLTRTGAFDVFNVATGGSLTIGSADATKTITIDGANIVSTADSLVENNGTFNLLANAILTGGNAGTSNDSSYRGGALHNAGDATATLYGTVTGNTAYNGGAIYNQGTLIIEDGTYTDNTAYNGGGVIYGSGTVTINAGTFHDNATKAATAGVVYCNGTLNINGGTFYKNSAKTGGGVANVAGTAIFKNATMYENSLTGSIHAGGAIYVSKGKTLTLENCAIYSNSLDYISNTNPGCDVSLGTNVILNLKNNKNIGIVQQRYDGSVGTINILEEYTGSAVLIPYDDTYTIGSTLVYFDSTMTTEMKVNTVKKLVVRDVVSETEFDDATYCVDTDGLLQYKDAEAKIGTITYPTLAEAVTAATSGDTVYVLKDIELSEALAIGDSETATSLTITNVIGKDIKLTRANSVSIFTVANGSALTIGSADTANKLIVDGGYVADAEEPLTGSAIENAGTFTMEANATIQNASAGSAKGGALNNTGTATLYGTLTANRGSDGGAIYNTGELTIKDGTYTGNIATAAGGVIHSNDSGAIVRIENGTFEYNEAQGGSSGVIYGKGEVYITGGTFKYNKAKTGGGVMNVAGSSKAEISNATITDNFLTASTMAGGAVYMSGKATLTLADCTINGNSAAYEAVDNPGCDISLGANTTLNVYDNTNVGIIYQKYGNSVGSINVLEEYTGSAVLIPFKDTYTIGSALVYFDAGMTAEEKTNTVEKLVVRDVVSETEFDDTTYCVDTDGLLQYKGAEAKIGTITYPTLVEAVTAATSGDTVYVLKDIELSEAIAIGDSETATSLTITNVSGKDIKLTRTNSVSMFTVASGSALTIGNADTVNKLTLDGGYVSNAETPLTGESLVNNAGTFELSANATLQNASTGGVSNGGALYNTGNATLYGNMTGNTANEGGAIKNAAGSVTIHSGTYSGNVSSGGAGGVIHSGTTGNEVTINGGYFYKNEAQSGTAGVVYCNGTLIINGGEYYENKAVSGGGVVNVAGTATITNAIMHDNSLTNSSNAGGAIYVSKGKTVTLEECTIYSNAADYKSNVNHGCDVSLGTNVILNLKNNKNIGIVQQRHTGEVAIINVLEEYTSPIIFIPYNNSPVVDAQLVYFAETMGSDAKATSAGNMIVRKYASETEYNDDTYYVDSDGYIRITSDVAKVGDASYSTLAEAIAAVETSDATTIYVLRDSDISETIAVGTADATKNITITNAPGVDVTFTRGSELTTEMFNVASGSALNITGTVTVDGNEIATATYSLVENSGTFTLGKDATLTGGNAGTASGTNNRGGALYNASGATATLAGNVTGNKAYYGGGIYNLGSLTITGGEYSGNTGNQGGALYSTGKSCVLDIQAGNFTGNSATANGGVMNVNNNATISNAVMNGNAITGSSGANGSAIYFRGNYTLSLKNCDIRGNTLKSFGTNNHGSDIGLGDGSAVILKLYNNINIGVIHWRYNSNGLAQIQIVKSEEFDAASDYSTYLGNIALRPNGTDGFGTVTIASDFDSIEGARDAIVGSIIAHQNITDADTYDKHSISIAEDGTVTVGDVITE